VYQIEALEKRVLLSGYAALTALASFNGTNGEGPIAGVVFDSSGDMFRTAYYGGASNGGTVFEIPSGSSTITAVASFYGANGANPSAPLVLDSSGDLLGTTEYGGTYSVGTVFEIARGSGVITTLASFNRYNGAEPCFNVALDSSGNIFGTTSEGGNLSLYNGLGDGTVFEVAQGSGAITALASFNGTFPAGAKGVVLDSSGDIFGATNYGGANGDGEVFEIAQGGGTISTLASFNGAGSEPSACVILDSSGDLFGTTVGVGGANGGGTIFEIAQGGAVMTTLATFNFSTAVGNVALDPAGDLFGTNGAGDGTVFEMVHGSAAITTLATFNSANGAYPESGVTLDSSGDLFGTTNGGGSHNDGTAFELLTLRPTAVTSSNPSAVYCEPITFTATVNPGSTGTVQFQIDGSNVGSPVALGGNTAAYTTSTLTAGSHSIVAVYSGDSTFAPSTSPTLTQNVAKVTASNARAITLLASFNGTNGTSPADAVLDPSGNVFGTAWQGGANGNGAVFEVAHGSGAITVLVSFNGINGDYPAPLVLDSSGNLFGATAWGGPGYTGGISGDGTVYEIGIGSDLITTLASFNGTDGATPLSLVLDSSGDLFGSASRGGPTGGGTVFEVARASGAITAIASLNIATGITSASLAFDSSGNLFGAASGGGSSDDGTVFEIARGSGIVTPLASFDGANGTSPGSIVLDPSGDIYGGTSKGGAYGYGTVFEVAQGTTVITTLVSLSGANGTGPPSLHLDSTGSLFGGTEGGANGDGTLYGIAQGSSAITTLVTFNGTNGNGPTSMVMDSCGDILGTTRNGGAHNDGTVYEATSGSALTSSNTLPAYGQPVTFTATVGPKIGVGPSGTVQFQIDGSNVGSPVALSGDTATYTTSTLNAGSHSIVAVYSGDSNFASMTSPVFTQNVGPAPLALTAGASYVKLDASGQHVDVWNNATAAGSPGQCVPCCDICGVTYTGPGGGDTFVLDYSNGDPLPASGISLTGGAGQNTLEIIGDPAGGSGAITIDGGAFTIPAGTPGAGTANYTLGTISIAAGAELALGQSDSQADQTVLAVNNLAVAGTLDIANNTLLANESDVSLSQITTWVQGQIIISSLVTGPHAVASRAVGYGDNAADPLTVPAGDVEVRYVPTGDTNLDGVVDIKDLTTAINDLGQSSGYPGGDVLNKGVVNVHDITAIINDLGATFNASGDGEGAAAAAVQSSAGAVTPAALGHAAVRPPAAGGLVGSLFSDTRIAGDWLESAGTVLGTIDQ
jgi:uncharacterized repeat protein (TIGR03803 family)